MKRTSLRIALFSVLAVGVLWAAQVNGYFDFFQITAPGNPPAGQTRTFVDATQKIFYDLTDGGVKHHTVATSSCSGGTPVVGNINNDGSVTCAAGGGGTFTATPPYLSDGTLFYGPTSQFIKPIDANYSWVNQGTATETTQNGSVTLVDQTNESNFNIHARVKTAPATPYHVIIAFTYYQGSNTNELLGAGWRDSATSKMIIYGVFQNLINQIVAFTATNPTTFGGTTPINQTGFQFSGGVWWLRIGDDGTNRTYDIGTDGQTWLNLLTEADTTFLTANQVMFFINGGKASIRLLSWQETV